MLNLFILLLFTAFFVSGQDPEKDNVFEIPITSDVKIDTTSIPGAIVGVGIDYEYFHRTNAGTIVVYAFGIAAKMLEPQSDGWIRFAPQSPTPSQGCVSAGILGTMPNLLIGFLMIWICSGRFNWSMLILCFMVVFGSVSSIPPVRIIVYIPEDHSALLTLTVNSNIIPMVSPKVDAEISISCQVNGGSVPCGSQVCEYGDKDCILSDAEYVGVLLPLTPEKVNATGPVMKDAISYYVDIDGFTLPYIQYIFCDTHADSATAKEIVDDLYTNLNVNIYIGPLTTTECQAIMAEYDEKLVLISPAATSTELTDYNTIISLSMSNYEYVQALDMIIENDFDNTLQNVILVYINNNYGTDIYNTMGIFFEATIHPFPYASDYSDIASVVQSAADNQLNFTAVVIIANGGEIGDILAAATGTGLTDYPWYTIGLSYNAHITESTAIGTALQVQLKSLEFRGSNIEAQTADRTLFYETFCADNKYNKPLPASIALGFDAALLITNTPLIFETTPYQAYFLLIEHGIVTFGYSGWLTMDDTGFRSNGDFICQIVDTSNPLKDQWLELGYVQLDRHKILGDIYYEITYRVVTNYVVPGNWSTSCSSANLIFFARNIRRQYTLLQTPDLDATSSQDIAVPLYDTFLIEYKCDSSVITQACPSALYGSDTQCETILEAISSKRSILEMEENQAPPPPKPAGPRQVCSNAGSTAGCVVGGKTGNCGRANSTCAKAAFKDACNTGDPKGAGFC